MNEAASGKSHRPHPGGSPSRTRFLVWLSGLFLLARSPTTHAQIDACMSDLMQSDKNQDGKLSQAEYLGFLALQSDGRLPNSLNQLPFPFISIFTFGACSCSMIEGADEKCCVGPDNFQIQLGSDLYGETEALATVEAILASVCQMVNENIAQFLPATPAPTLAPQAFLTPTVSPTRALDVPTTLPSASPTMETGLPSDQPSDMPSLAPTISVPPSVSPSESSPPTVMGTQPPTGTPSDIPSLIPSLAPTQVESDEPSSTPSMVPTNLESDPPSVSPSLAPTQVESDEPSSTPSMVPTNVESDPPSVSPTSAPTIVDTDAPSVSPSATPTAVGTDFPSIFPSVIPTVAGTDAPSVSPSETPTFIGTDAPSVSPSVTPTIVGTDSPSVSPSVPPTVVGTDAPSVSPSVTPTFVGTDVPSVSPSVTPTIVGTDAPSVSPSVTPTFVGTDVPSVSPSVRPTIVGTDAPTVAGTDAPSTSPSATPTIAPTALTARPTGANELCLSFQFGIVNNAGVEADDIFNMRDNTLKTGLIIATENVTIEALNASQVRGTGGRLFNNPGLRRPRPEPQAFIDRLVVPVGFFDGNRRLPPARRGLEQYDRPQESSFEGYSRRLVFYTADIPPEIREVIDNPFCQVPNPTPLTRCSIVTTVTCVILEEGDNREAIRNSLRTGIEASINFGRFEAAIPIENRLPDGRLI